MTREDVLERLADPRPIRATLFAEMCGYAAHTLRAAIRAGKIEGVRLPGSPELRVPVDEARRVLAALWIIPSQGKDAKDAKGGASERKPLRMVGA